jgi:hypothetical protein
LIDEIVRDGARRMLAAALEAEVAAYIAAYTDRLDAEGRRLVVRNGHAGPRQVLTSAGAVQVQTPRVNDKRVDEVTGERRRFASAILPAWCRKSPEDQRSAAIAVPARPVEPGLRAGAGRIPGYRFGPVRNDDHPADRAMAGWAKAFGDRNLSGVDYVYVWADGIHVNIRLDEERLCLLVMVGVRVDGTKELIALAEGYRESPGRGQAQGFAAEAAQALVSWLHGQGANVITANIHPDHHASAKVAARAGLTATAEELEGERVWRTVAD